MTVDEKIRPQQSWPWWRWILVGLNLIALVLSIILSWHYFKGGSMAGCNGGSSCEEVLTSRWSMVAGVLPVSSLATGVYLAMLVAGFFIGPATETSIRRLSWSVLLVLVGSIAGSAIWFFIVQKWIIGEFCLYCMTTHITGILLTALIIWRAAKEFRGTANRPLRTASLTLSGMALAGILVATQFGFAPKVIYSSGESQDTLPAIDYHTAPMVGSPNARYIVSLLFDYQCPHCQKIHFMLDEATRRYNGQLAFVLCPTPLNAECNQYISQDADAFKNSCELAKISLAVWVADPKMFAALENWMFTFESGDNWHPRSVENTKAKAVALVGQAEFDKAWSNPWIEQYIQTCVRIYGQTLQGGKGGVPKLIFGSHWVTPEVNNTEELLLILQKSLAVPKT